MSFYINKKCKISKFILDFQVKLTTLNSSVIFNTKKDIKWLIMKKWF